ncbi:hypothetical protein CXG52_12160 [Pseudomonas plecoglossicida]|uniref:Uncharacterized protein n=1 Tax=Pseudomonas plecoglossicida TaxID=70775 RepID=A0ABX4U5V6_PSEDL|nr:hypothetical protein CSW00_12375 [Pseudomonas sp. MR 02]PLP91510.1 hypothetical protein CX682_12265 [Pseudomonas sp. FFUP_PS_41]PLU87230.1 hypothetical protein CXG44_11880 [Pseudomonas plecoglossicida]TXI07344.1 MAG: hypothetical protein E6Q70_05395 [Pseudomonas monteilii]PLU93395.1 hypothetical protein CXG45_10090 [Pseudomonas plecoglossicida]
MPRRGQPPCTATKACRGPCGRLPSPFGLRCRAENKYRSSDAAFVGAALCCEEAGTSNRQALSVPASSQHKAAPTEPRRTNESCVVL